MRSTLSDFFGSVLVRLLLIFGSLAAMTAAAIVIGWMVFQSIATNMAILSEERLPELRDSAGVVSVTDRLRAVLSDILIASEPENLEKLAFKTSLILGDIRTAAEAFGPGQQTELTGKIDRVAAALKTLTAARGEEFRSAEGVAKAVQSALELANEATVLLTTATDDAYFDLVIGAEDTISSIDATLTQLIEKDFIVFQAALGARSEVNLLSGIALSILQTRDTAMVTILQDLGSAASERLSIFAAQINEAGTIPDLAGTLTSSNEFFSSTIASRGRGTGIAETLSQRQSVDAALSSALDSLYFDFVINSESAKEENASAIQNLMDDQVTQIRDQAAVDAATKSFFAAAMQSALARDPYELSLREAELQSAGQLLTEVKSKISPDIAAHLDAILAVADTKTGISAIRASAFDAQRNAAEATTAAAEAVRDIAVAVSEFASASQTQIELAADQLNAEVSAARQRMQQIGFLSLLIVLAAPVFVWLMVTRPLNRVTGITQRLAAGDLSEIEGTERYKGEIGKLTNALQVFREGSLERQRMQEEEKARQADLNEAERKSEKQKRDAEVAAQKAKELREREEREREEQERVREEELRRAAEEEREARAEEQEVVVSQLASSLKSLSVGDLTHTIETEFPGEYETLRQDYNEAVSNLADLIGRIGLSAEVIDSSSAEIAASSLDLSRRTENSAATLEETAAALSQMTSSVSSAAEGASDAFSTVEVVKRDTEASRTVMHDAVSAMSEIEGSSRDISKIVEVIDSIAFQTNLLALNAGVEAARAGEAGRGFAVVASEVRILAHRCSEAALQIGTLITQSTDHVEKGVSLIDQTNHALSTILEGITNVSQNVSEIAVSAKEQSGGIGEINSAVEQLDQTTQQNAAMFEETTAASQSLTEEAGKLARIVSSFRIPGASDIPAQSDDTNEFNHSSAA